MSLKVLGLGKIISSSRANKNIINFRHQKNIGISYSVDNFLTTRIKVSININLRLYIDFFVDFLKITKLNKNFPSLEVKLNIKKNCVFIVSIHIKF